MAINANLSQSEADIIVASVGNVIGSADTLFLDTFTDVNFTQIQNHPPDIGDSWERLWGSNATVDAVITNNLLTFDDDQDDGVAYAANTTYPSSANYGIEWRRIGVPASVTRPAYGLLRIQDIDNFYALYLRSQGGSGARLYKKFGGVFSTVGTAFQAPNALTSIRFLMIGETIVVVYDDVIMKVETDSSITAAGRAGFAAGGGSELIETTEDCHHNNEWDDFVVFEAFPDITVEAVAGVLQGQAQAPDLSLGSSFSVPTGYSNLWVPQPQSSSGVGLSVPVGAASLAALPPEWTSGSNLASPPGAVSLLAPIPELSVSTTVASPVAYASAYALPSQNVDQHLSVPFASFIFMAVISQTEPVNTHFAGRANFIRRQSRFNESHGDMP